MEEQEADNAGLNVQRYFHLDYAPYLYYIHR